MSRSNSNTTPAVCQSPSLKRRLTSSALLGLSVLGLSLGSGLMPGNAWAVPPGRSSESSAPAMCPSMAAW